MNRFVALLLLLVTPLFAQAQNWPQWRGPANNGISKDKSVATSWGEDKNVAWKLPMPGIAGSTPAIWGEKIFLTSADGKDLVLMCVGTDGKVQWKKAVAKTNRAAFRGDEGNEAGASPSTDGALVICYFGTGDLACYDFDGNEVWKKNLQKEYGAFSIQHGMHITPLLDGDNVYAVILTNGKSGHLIVCFDKGTGKELWKHERKSDARGESREAYSSPIMWTTGKEPCLVVLGCDYTTAHSLKDGSEIWRLADLNPKAKYSDALRIIASPVANKDELVVPTARGGLVVAMKPGATGTVSTEYELWRKKSGAPDVPSPLIYDGNVYLARENGILHVWDALTGKERYNQRLHSDRGRASPVAVAGNVITTSREGTFHVIKAGPEYQLVSQNTLKDTFTASPAISGGRIYLRGFANLYAIEEKK